VPTGYQPYEETGIKAALRGALAGLAASSRLPRGASFLQSLGAGASGAFQQRDLAQKAAQDYAMKQMQAEQAAEDRQVRNRYTEALMKNLEKPAKPEKPEKKQPWELDPEGQKQYIDFQSRLKKATTPPEKPEKPKKPDLGNYNTLADNFRADKDVQNYTVVRDNFRRINDTLKLGSGFGDLGAIFSYMRVLDPNSVVRETEFKNAEEAVGYVQRTYNLPERWFKGTRLTVQGRRELREAGKRLHDTQKDTYTRKVKLYENAAKKYEVDPELIVPSYGDDVAPPAAMGKPDLIYNPQTGTLEPAR
jgi:hypothetical protein